MGIPNRSEFDYKQAVKEKKQQAKLDELDYKTQKRNQINEVKLRTKEVELQKLYEKLAILSQYNLDAKKYFEEWIANVIADYFSKINFDKVDKNMKKLLANQNFTIVWRQALKTASKDKMSGIITYNSAFSKKPVVMAGHIPTLEMEDDTITRLIINTKEKYNTIDNYTYFEWINVKGKVKYKRWVSKFATYSEKDVPTDTKFITTTYTQIPVAVMQNNEEMESDIKIVESIIDLWETTLKKSFKQMKMGGVKGFLERNLLGQGALKGEQKQQAKLELMAEMEGDIVMFDLNNVPMNSFIPTNQPLIQIENLPFQLKDLKDFMTFNMELIFKTIGIPMDKAKQSAQETDSQVANTNKLQNNSIQAKKLLREFTLKQMIINLSMVMSNLEGTQQSEYSTKLIENIEDVEVEIELEQDINDKMKQDELENKNNIQNKKGDIKDGQQLPTRNR